MLDGIQVFQTTRATDDRLTKKDPLAFAEYVDGLPSVFVDSRPRFQTIEGFGGSFTESAADTFYRMSPEIRKEVLRAYFDPATGNAYTLCRTHINSCDFSLGNYAYSEMPGDVDLRHFSIDHDRRQLIPMIKEAISVAGRPLNLVATPWSPPAWMKTNGQMNQGGKLKAEYKDAWAQYFIRYVEEYKKEGLPIWGISVQNEPQAVQTWDSCIYSGEEERDFVRDHLGPAFEQAGLFGRIKILIWDHNRDLLYERAKVVYDDPQAERYVWGAAFHWYVGDNFENVRLTHDAYPEKHLLFTEGCVDGESEASAWETGERYGHSMLQDLNHWANGWMDWNLLLDQRGGPNHKDNYCKAPLMADTTKGTLEFHPSYYYLGHVTRYVKPGAQRIVSASSLDDLETSAFINPDGRIALVVLNRSGKNLPFSIKYNKQAALTESPAHSISSFLFSSE